MSPVFVVIADVFVQQSSQVSLVQNDHMVKQLPTHTPNPALGDAVLPGTSKRGSDRFRAVLFDGRDYVRGELCIAVKDQEPMWLIVSPSFAQLQYNPQGVRLPGHVAVENLPPIVADDEETVQNSKGQSRHGEEIHRSDCFAVVAKKCQPAPGWIRITIRALHPARNRSFRDVETQFEQFPVDARRSPSWVFRDHAKNQIAKFLGQGFSSANAPSSRKPAPIQPKPSPMPANHGLRGDKYQRSLPASPKFSQNDPEQPVDRTQSRAWSLCMQSQQLLPKGEVLEEEFSSGAKGGDNPAEQMSKAHEHQVIIAKSAQ